MAVEARQRLDKWLFFARLQKSRTLAAKLVTAGKIRVNREKVDNAARTVKPGDVLTITFERQVLVVRVELPGTRRGPAAEARTLYTNLSEPGAAGQVVPTVADLSDADDDDFDGEDEEDAPDEAHS
jgi:ribosome-associated heat shock protein Hsp15